MKRWLACAGWPAAVLLLVLGGWQGACAALRIPGYILPPPGDVWRAVVGRHENLFFAFRITALEAAGGFGFSVLAGVAIALCFAQSPVVRRSFYPYTILLQTVPIVAVAPLILMWFGAGTRSVMLVAFIICLFPIIANTTQGLISVPRNLVELFQMANASRAEVLFKLRFPHALPAFFTGLRISAGISVIGAITGELFASSNTVGRGGLGYSIIYANSQLQTDYLFALVLTASALGFLMFFAVVFLEWLWLHRWHESAMRAGAE
ncbi:MAG TPA: ABC transporter permease [Verrucomicrobiota bacterium]|nr:ABC transporter permease [Verrucomicrobiota bacterium]